MPNPGTSDYHRYLTAKKSIDDRSLNPRVWDSLARALPRTRPTDVLELGAGIGSMVQRVIERGLLTDCRYRAVDLEPGNVAEATRRLPPWARERDLSVEEMGEGGLRFSGAGVSMDLSFEAANVVDVLKKPDIRGVYDFVIAQAFLDLVDLDSVLPLIGASLRPEGLIYLCINFDGGTIFDPIIDKELDARIEALYHRTMDERVSDGKASGDSRTGRRLFSGLRRIGAQVLDAGPSDWVVYPSVDGYSGDDDIFLHAIIDTVQGALQSSQELDPQSLAEWTSERHSQVESRELVYIAHQLDVLARVH